MLERTFAIRMALSCSKPSPKFYYHCIFHITLLCCASQTLCHFDTKVLDSAFHSVKIISALPAVEVPTGAFVPGQLVQKRATISVEHEKAIDANTHADPKTPDKPNDKWGEYPTAMTASAQRLVRGLSDNVTSLLVHMSLLVVFLLCLFNTSCQSWLVV